MVRSMRCRARGAPRSRNIDRSPYRSQLINSLHPTTKEPHSVVVVNKNSVFCILFRVTPMGILGLVCVCVLEFWNWRNYSWWVHNTLVSTTAFSPELAAITSLYHSLLLVVAVVVYQREKEYRLLHYCGTVFTVCCCALVGCVCSLRVVVARPSHSASAASRTSDGSTDRRFTVLSVVDDAHKRDQSVYGFPYTVFIPATVPVLTDTGNEHTPVSKGLEVWGVSGF